MSLPFPAARGGPFIPWLTGPFHPQAGVGRLSLSHAQSQASASVAPAPFLTHILLSLSVIRALMVAQTIFHTLSL